MLGGSVMPKLRMSLATLQSKRDNRFWFGLSIQHIAALLVC